MEDGVILSQPKLATNLVDHFSTKLKANVEYKTPASPKHPLQPSNKEPLSEEDHNAYRSGVGSLLFLSRHTRPELANGVRELSKFNSTPTIHHQKALLRLLRYLQQTVTDGIKLSPMKTNKWEIQTYADTDWAGDPCD